MSDKRWGKAIPARGHVTVRDAIYTCWELLSTGHIMKRAAAILLLQEVEQYLMKTGRGDVALELRRRIKEEDQKRFPRYHDENGIMRP